MGVRTPVPVTSDASATGKPSDEVTVKENCRLEALRPFAALANSLLRRPRLKYIVMESINSRWAVREGSGAIRTPRVAPHPSLPCEQVVLRVLQLRRKFPVISTSP